MENKIDIQPTRVGNWEISNDDGWLMFKFALWEYGFCQTMDDALDLTECLIEMIKAVYEIKLGSSSQNTG